LNKQVPTRRYIFHQIRLVMGEILVGIISPYTTDRGVELTQPLSIQTTGFQHGINVTEVGQYLRDIISRTRDITNPLGTYIKRQVDKVKGGSRKISKVWDMLIADPFHSLIKNLPLPGLEFDGNLLFPRNGSGIHPD